MSRYTSTEAYNTIKENGLLSKRRWQVYDLLWREGTLTRNEISKRLTKQKIRINPNLVSSRLVELRQMGVVSEVGTKICPLTKMEVIAWTVTANLPVKFEKPHREKCKTCQGKGYIRTQQLKFDLRSIIKK